MWGGPETLFMDKMDQFLHISYQKMENADDGTRTSKISRFIIVIIIMHRQRFFIKTSTTYLIFQFSFLGF